MILITDAVSNTLKKISNKYVKQKLTLQSNGPVLSALKI